MAVTTGRPDARQLRWRPGVLAEAGFAHQDRAVAAVVARDRAAKLGDSASDLVGGDVRKRGSMAALPWELGASQVATEIAGIRRLAGLTGPVSPAPRSGR
jgi:hypothetical protein